MVGRCHDNGWGTPQDPEAAAEQYLRAAEAGHAWAQYNLGHLYLDGRGVAQDFAAAFLWYRRAAQQQHPRAMNLAGRCCEQGWGTPRDPAAAADWYRRSAEAGYFRGQYNWASDLLQAGRRDEAMPWLERAATGAPPARYLRLGEIMLVRIPKLLTDTQVAHLSRALDAQAAPWVDGRATAGHQGAPVKNNLQIDEASALARELGTMVIGELERCPLFISAVLPHRVYPPLFNRYAEGMHFGTHVDGAVRMVPGTGHKLRTDLSATLFLAPPQSYEGGELMIDTDFGSETVKLAAGDMVVYTSTSRHRVTPVTRGVRTACVFWIQSLIRDDLQREQLFELDRSIQRLTETASGSRLLGAARRALPHAAAAVDGILSYPRDCLYNDEGSAMRQSAVGFKVLGIAAAALVAQLFTHASLADAVAAPPRPMVLKAAHLFDSVSGKLSDHGVVVIVGTKIQAVGSDAAIPARVPRSSIWATPPSCRASSMRTCICRSRRARTGTTTASTASCASPPSRPCTARTMPRRLSRRGSPRCATWAPRTTLRSACAMPSTRA